MKSYCYGLDDTEIHISSVCLVFLENPDKHLLLEETPECSFSLAFSLHICNEERPCEHTARRHPSTSQEKSSHQEQNWLVP